VGGGAFLKRRFGGARRRSRQRLDHSKRLRLQSILHPVGLMYDGQALEGRKSPLFEVFKVDRLASPAGFEPALLA
jgi:hypothetical protein